MTIKVAINDLGDPATNAHLTQYDTVHGKFPGTVSVDGDCMVVNGDRIRVLANRNPAELPWAELGVDVVMECTGFFTTKEKASAHLRGGAKKVIISAPGGKDVDATIVFGVNHKTLKASDTVISNASCTTNCLAPLVKPLHDAIGLESGLMTTIHSYTNDQVLTDVYHEDLRRARSATQSMIPTKTGAAAAVGLVLPELNGKLDGFAIRVPTINVSVVDLTFTAKRATSVDEVNAALPLRGGVLDLLEECRSCGVLLAIATTTSRSNVEVLLHAHLGDRWAEWFPVVVCGEDVQRKKPDPEVYVQALRKLKLRPLEAVAIKDSAGGTSAACAADVPVIVALSSYFSSAAIEGAIAIGPSLGERRGWRPALPQHGNCASPVRLSDIESWHAQRDSISQYI